MRRVLVIVTAILLVSGCGTSAPATGTPAADVPVDPGHDAADVAFVMALIPHHREGIALATVAARQPQAHTLAEAIITTEQDEVARMSGWLKVWGLPGPAAASPTATPAEALRAPRGRGSAASGSPDVADALRALASHQEEAIKLAQKEQAQGSNRDALAFAKQIIESRTAEAEQLRADAA